MRLNNAVPRAAHRLTVFATAGATALAIGLVAAAAPAAAVEPTESTTYTNPVSSTFADTFADPAVIRGKDGYWYAYGTTDPLFEGEAERHLIPISRSTDLVTWEYVGDAFTEETLPSWADTDRDAALWAPDIRYVDGEYRLYYVVTETTRTDEPNDNAIGVATAPTPVGPWTDSGAPVVEPRRGGGGEPGNFLWTFDPSHVVGPDGTEYLFYGSYYGGIYVTELSEDGLRAVGEPTMVAIDNKYEGSYVVYRDGYWYLFASSANCCAGPTTGYSVHVGRSESLDGPYVDREGVPLLQSRAGGTPVIAPNGNEWVGTGHNAIVTDLAGQDWFVYHAIDRDDPYLTGTSGINERPMLIDRLDWIDGWPTVRAGEWASSGPEEGPVTGGRAADDFSDGLGRPWRADGWTTGQDADAGQHAVSEGAGSLVTRHAVTYDVRIEADLRLADGTSTPYGLVAGQRPHGELISAAIDPATNQLVLSVTNGKGAVVAEQRSDLPDDFVATAWHSMVLEVEDGVASAEVTHARLGDPLAVASVALPAGTKTAGSAGALAGGAGVHVDNLSVLPTAEEVTERVPLPRTGEVLFSDEFEGADLGAGWTVVRDPDYTVVDGELVWQTETADLVGGGNDAGLLLVDAPEGDWVAETQLTIDLGTDTVRNYQQGGLIAYVHDDLFARLSHVAIWNTRQTEFGYEIPWEGGTSYGGTIIGPPSDTTWLRLVGATDETGEHEVQGFTSTDGTTWIAGGVWTFPAGSDVQVGLISHGDNGQGPAATSEFEYLRIYALAE